MKKLVLLLLCLASVLGCESLSDAVKAFNEVYGDFPDRPVSLKIDGVSYSSETDNPSKFVAYHFPVKLTITDGEENGFSFRYLRNNFNSKGAGQEIYALNLKMASPEGSFALNHRYDLGDESLTGRPFVMFNEKTESGYGSYKTFTAKSGWIEFTECDPEAMTLGGVFEFTAVCSNGDSYETIEVTDGSFSNIPYENVISEE